MKTLRITTPFSGGVTVIPNNFVKQHMIHANGEFVKIYLYLMYASENQQDTSLTEIADALSCTESDVSRALRYWEREGLLYAQEMDCDADSQHLHYDKQQISDEYSQENDSAYTKIAASARTDSSSDTSKNTTAALQQPVQYKPLTAEKVKQLKENSAIAELLFIAQQYLGKLLTPTETNRILFFYEELHFSTDLIEYLIEYCVSKGHRSIHYIEKVAFAWKEEGIITVEDAKKSGSCCQKEYYAILKALGIRGRGPIDAEIAIMNTWISDYGFTLDIITEACTRTIMTTKQPSLQYADRILSSWKEADVHTISDVRKLDQAYEQMKAAEQNKVSKQENVSEKNGAQTSEYNKAKQNGKTNRFSNFDQRSYNYDDLESQLLNHS